MKKKMFVMFTILTIILCLFGSAAAADDGAKVLEQVSPSLVRIHLNGGFGTGFFINDRHIVTNHHIISPYLEDNNIGGTGWFKQAENTQVDVIYSLIGNDFISGVVIADWPEVDLAVVEVDPTYTKRESLKLSSEANIGQGMSLYVLGYPSVNSGSSMDGDVVSITGGVLSKINRKAIGYTNGTPFLQLSYDSITNPGNSGGPVVDKDGNVIGVHNSSSTEGIAFFGIHVKELTDRLDDARIPYTKADTGSKGLSNTAIILIALGVCIAAAAVVFFLLRNKKKDDSQGTGEPSLQGITGQYKGIKKLLSKDKDCIIGTDPSACTIRFEPGVKGVSARHCRIHYSKSYQRFVIQDLNSERGTQLVRGSEVREVPTDTGLALRHGDIIYIPNQNNSFKVNL